MSFWQANTKTGVEVDWSNPINHALAAALLFQEKSDTIFWDASGRNPPATSSGTPPPSHTGGLHGTALSFVAASTNAVGISGTSSKVNPNIQYSPLGFSMAFWLKHASSQLGVIYSESQSDGAITMNSYFTVDNKLNLSILTPAATWPIATSAAALALNTWYHLVFTCGPLGQLDYVNGVQDGFNANTSTNYGYAPTATAAMCGIGAQYNKGWAYPFDGLIESVMLWKRQLKPSEVLYLYGQPYNNIASPSGLSALASLLN
jgi:hypothetical protein